MLNKIRLFFLKRAWLRLNNQITLTRRRLHTLKVEKQKVVKEIAGQRIRERSRWFSHYEIEYRFGPIHKQVRATEKALHNLEDKKHRLHVKIEGLESVNLKDFDGCKAT
jgi:hypothetical protein